ncbi:hypothetical protein [Paenibacillus tyrfis]|uniref:hypothetical protein n=1 Tax=Paenibacillus tyrfis TaxID=1501230 RepID=UPI000A7A90FE|nr:hypothetical protein [Paenibacillus tyrfis]
MVSLSPVRDIQKLSETDISGLIALSESVGWDYAEPELRTVLPLPFGLHIIAPQFQ